MDDNKQMFEVNCDDKVSCGYIIRGYDTHDLVDGLKHHAKQKHNLEASDEEILAKIKEV